MSARTSAPIVIEGELQAPAEQLYRVLREHAGNDDEAVRLAFALLAYAIGVRDGGRA